MRAEMNDRKARRFTIDQPRARRVRLDLTTSPQIAGAIM